jgi:tRNA dimethylallyltransferase
MATATATAGSVKPRVLVLAGPTGTGKTALSLHLARQLHGEIISADSAQVFRGMNIGTDKVSRDDQRSVHHTHVDTVDFGSDASSAFTFAQTASASIADMIARGKTPIIVGGAGFLLKFLLYGTQVSVPANWELRNRLTADVQAVVDRCQGAGGTTEQQWEQVYDRCHDQI